MAETAAAATFGGPLVWGAIAVGVVVVVIAVGIRYGAKAANPAARSDAND